MTDEEAPPPIGLTEADLPALFRLGDHAAVKGQARFFWTVRLQLGMLLVGSVAGLSVQVFDISQLAYIGVAAYIVLVILRLNIKVSSPDAVWYENRLIAESAKSLAWRYAVGGAPFGIAEGTDRFEEADQLLSERLSEIIRDVSHVPLPDPTVGTQQITPAMRELRAAPLEERIRVFADARVDTQLLWYAAKAKVHSKRAARLDTAMLVASGTAVAFGFSQALGLVNVNLLGLAGITAAIVATWNATTHYGKQASDYSVAAHQLTLVATMIDHQKGEENWADFVNDAEDGISREHTSWRVARAQP